jgi:hypothetical protein
MKLKYEAFIEMTAQLVTFFENHFKPRTWLGHRLLAVDGSTVRLPISEPIADHFGELNSAKGAPSPMARISQFFDVLNKITVDAIIENRNIGERELAARHFLKLVPNDLVLLDRGYPAWWLFRMILTMDANFCARISCTKWKIVRKFFHSGRAEKIIRLPINASSVSACRQQGLDTSALRLRLVRVELEGGEIEILITSLLDAELYPVDVFRDLYHDRWPVEEDYKTIKCPMELENFTGKSVLSVQQDFHAKIFAKNLVAVMAFPIKDAIDQDSQNKQYQYQINFTQALSKSKGVIVLLFHDTEKKIRRLIIDLQEIFQRTVEPIRPGRKYPRNHKAKPRKFFPSYKPIA